MSLVVSLRVPDGIVAASDSLSTAHNILEFVAEDFSFECPSCKKVVSEKELRLPPFPIPYSASSFTQKLFSIYSRYSLSSFGQGIINNRSIYHHINQFINHNKNPEDLEQFKDLLIKYFESELLKQYPKYKEEAPDSWTPVGFHLNGFEIIDDVPGGVTYEIFIGRENIIRKRDNIGCVIGGDMKVVQKLWEIGKENERLKFKYHLFTLQDAIDFCEFLIMTTSTFQRFANEVQTVGGEIDIALLTNRGFQWIKRKKLMKVLENQNDFTD